MNVAPPVPSQPSSNAMTNFMETVSKNRSYIGIGIFVVIMVLYLIYRKYRDIVRQEKREPVFIKTITRTDKSLNFPKELIPAPAYGSAFTFTTWLYVNDITSSTQSDRLKHVFHKGSELGADTFTCSPGVWILPKSNNMVVVTDTDDNREGVCSMRYVMYGEHINGEIDVQRIVKTKNGEEYFLLIDGQYLRVSKPERRSSTQTIYIGYYKEIAITTEAMNMVRNFQISDLDSYTRVADNKHNVKRTRTTAPLADCLSSNSLPNKILIENIPLQRWFHLVIVADESSLEVYVDGKLYRTTVLSAAPRLNDGKLYVNQKNTSTDLLAGFDGLINELRYYPKALNYTEIYTMYARGPKPFYVTDMMKNRFQKIEDEYNTESRIKEAVSSYSEQ